MKYLSNPISVTTLSTLVNQFPFDFWVVEQEQ